MTNLRFSHFLFLFLLPCLTYFFHEYAHWLAYHSYEIDAQLYVNTIRLPKEIRLTAMQKVIIYGSGVIFTLLQGVIGFWVALKKDSLIGFYILLSAAVFRWAAMMQEIFSTSDELKVSHAMDIPPLFWPLLTGICFFGMVFYSSKKLNVPLKTLTIASLSFLLITYVYSQL